MAKIYLIRHAESIANTQGRYQGQTYDTHLSDLGKKQAVALQKRLAKIKFASIFSSPLLRTAETSAVLGKPVLVKEILETNHGRWEGKSTAEIKRIWPKMYCLWKTLPSQVVFPGGEAFTQTAARAVSWLNNFPEKEGNYAVVTHTNIISAILMHLLKKDLDAMWQFDIQSTSISLVEASSGKKQLAYYNDSNHLVGLTSDLSKQAI